MPPTRANDRSDTAARCGLTFAGHGMPALLALLIGISGGCASLTNWNGVKQSQQTPPNMDFQFEVVRMAERSGSLTEARDAYTKILVEDPDYSPAMHRLGVVFVKLDEVKSGIEYLQRAVDQGNPTSELLGDLGFAHYLAGDLESANQTLIQALKLDPTDERLINNLAIVVGFQGQHAESLELFRQVNTEAESLANQSFILSQTGDLEKARKNLHQALDLDPTLKTAANSLLEFVRHDQAQSDQAQSASQVKQSKTR